MSPSVVVIVGVVALFELFVVCDEKNEMGKGKGRGGGGGGKRR